MAQALKSGGKVILCGGGGSAAKLTGCFIHDRAPLGGLAAGLLGTVDAELAKRCDLAIIGPGDVMARIQESHILLGHTLCGLVEQQLGFA